MLSYQIILPLFLIFNGLFYAFTLWNYSVGYPRANKYIALFFIIAALSVTQDLFRDTSPIYSMGAYVLFHPLTMVSGVAIYYFFRTLTDSDTKPIPYLIYHLIPIILIQVLIAAYVVRYIDYQNVSLWRVPFIAAIERFYQIYLAAYLILSYRLVKRHEQVLRYFVSNQSIHDLLWSKKILWAGIALWFSWTFLFLVSLYVAFTVQFFSFFYVFIVALRQKPATNILEVSYNEVSKIEQNEQKIVELKEIDPRIEIFKAELLDFMNTKKPYLDADLSLPKLAEMMNVTTHFLSQAINTSMEENFFQFVNRYRVEESKILLRDPNKSHFNIIQIAYEAGFNSKTTFNTVFKKMTGVPPSVFQKEALILP